MTPESKLDQLNEELEDLPGLAEALVTAAGGSQRELARSVNGSLPEINDPNDQVRDFFVRDIDDARQDHQKSVRSVNNSESSVIDNHIDTTAFRRGHR